MAEVIFAGQNNTVTPEAWPVHRPPKTVSEQNFVLVMTGVAVVNFAGTHAHDWTTETITINPDSFTPLQAAITRYGIPVPQDQQWFPYFSLEQWAPYAAVSHYDKEGGGVDLGFGVDDWRPTHFLTMTDVHGQTFNNLFDGINVDIAVRNNSAVLRRLSFQITLVGRIVIVPAVILRK